MKQITIAVLTSISMGLAAQPKAVIMTHSVDNKGDKLFSTIYPNPNKETILLLHGGPGFPGDLEEVATNLKDNFQVITFHQRGTKKSPCKSKDYSMEAYLSDIEAITRFYGIAKFHLWGHSWGGLYAQIYAETHPDKLLSLFLCCPGSGTNREWKETEKEVMQLNRSKCTSWQWLKMGVNNVRGILGSDRAYQRLFEQVMKNYNKGFVVFGKPTSNFENLKADPINKTRPEIIKYPLLKKQPKPSFKITITYGDGDIYQSSKKFVLNRYPTAKVIIIKNCGHIPWLHNPRDYEKILNQHYSMADF
jgi:proline iminopeptidase